MFELVNIVAIVGTTLFMMASATVWFSPLLFGKYWLQSLRVSEAEIEATRENVVVYLVTNFFFLAIALYVVTRLVESLGVLGMSDMYVAAHIALLAVAVVGSAALWEGKSKVNFVINAGFYVYFIIVGTLLVANWPW